MKTQEQKHRKTAGKRHHFQNTPRPSGKRNGSGGLRPLSQRLDSNSLNERAQKTFEAPPPASKHRTSQISAVQRFRDFISREFGVDFSDRGIRARRKHRKVARKTAYRSRKQNRR